MTFEDQPKPGSPEAIARGCTCPPDLNNNGQGTTGLRGRQFLCDWQCPLHGVDDQEAEERAEKAANLRLEEDCIIEPNAPGNRTVH